MELNAQLSTLVAPTSAHAAPDARTGAAAPRTPAAAVAQAPSAAPAPTPLVALGASGASPGLDASQSGHEYRGLSPLVQARDLTRRWGRGSSAQLGVDRVDLNIGSGELASIVGPSGSGKSTLGALIAGIDNPTTGSLVVDGTRIDSLSNDQLARWRGRTVGIVFQDFHLLPTLSAEENVELAVRLADRNVHRRDRRDRSREALASVGLADKFRRLPTQLSGGEQQRVAIARAMVTRPRLIVADEPTGSLDRASGQVIFDLLAGLTATGTTVLFITHDPELADRADRQIEMLDGRITAHTAAGIDMSPLVPSAMAHQQVAR